MKLLMKNWREYLREQAESTDRAQKEIFVLVGPPSVGKSTWLKNVFVEEAPYVINRDDIVEKVAGEMGWTYNDLFMPPPKEAQEGDVDEKYGTVVKSPAYMTWQPLSCCPCVADAARFGEEHSTSSEDHRGELKSRRTRATPPPRASPRAPPPSASSRRSACPRA